MHRSKVRNLKNAKGGSNHKTPVLGMISDNAKVIAKKIEKSNNKNILPIIGKTVLRSSTVVTDNFKVYDKLDRYYSKHVVVSHSKKEYVKDGYHTNSIEGFWSLFKRSIIGICHFVSPKHIQKYLDESAFRYNTRAMSESVRMNYLFSNIEVRTTYKALING
jgi:transposase-like protein